MSYIDELRARLEAVEQRFGRISENSREYRERLMGLISRIEEEMRCRREVQQQQADEIGRLSEENEQLRSMLLSLLQAVESRDEDSLGQTLNDLDAKVATLIGEGQGAPPMPAAGSGHDVPAEPAVAVDAAGEADEAMSAPMDDMSPSGEPDAGPAATATFEEAMPATPGTPATADVDDFLGAAGGDIDDAYTPAYAHPAGEWDDFLEETAPMPETAEAVDAEYNEVEADQAEEPPAADEPESAAIDMAAEAEQDAPAETVADAGPIVDDEADETLAAEPATDEAADDSMAAEDADDQTSDKEPGSIRDLLDRVKTQMKGDDGQTREDEDLKDDGGGTAAAE